jgi:thiol-disulfide isomerase/thioredoxin
MYIRFLTRRPKKLQKYLEKVETWNPSVFGLRSSDQIIKENLRCGTIADNHKRFLYGRSNPKAFPPFGVYNIIFMKLILNICFGFFFLLSPAQAQRNSEFQIISFAEFETLTKAPSERLRVFNFWATWCAPCVKEMPFFEQAVKDFPDIELVFISMDDGRKPERVTNFIEKRNIVSPVLLLDDVDFNSWIDKVDPSWSGAIPATLFVMSDGRRFFHEGEVNQEELYSMIHKLNQQ